MKDYIESLARFQSALWRRTGITSAKTRATQLTRIAMKIYDQSIEGVENNLSCRFIGNLPQDCGGADGYYLLTRNDDDLTEDQAYDWLMPKFYKQSNSAGEYFCTRMTVLPNDDSPNTKICVIHHEYDV